MKHIFKILIIATLSLALLSSSEAYYANRFLFNLNAEETPLTQEQMESLKTPYAQLNRLISKYNVVKIEPWLKNAKDSDQDKGVFLNRIYRLVTKQDVPAPFVFLDELQQANSAIKSAEQEAIMSVTGTIPNDPQKENQWYLTKAKVFEAWQLWDLEGGDVPGNRNIVVAVVDDGVEYTHPDLWKNIWINQDEISSSYFPLIDTNSDGYMTAEEVVNFVGDADGNGITNLKDVISSGSFLADGSDDDGDGYKDNLIGWDTNESGSSSDDDRDPMVTNNSHGTHVAGLVGATTNNGVGVASTAYNISIMPVKATGDETTNSINTGWDGILYAAQAGADIINCSWGGPGYSSYSQTLVNTVKNTYGALMIAAAGNGDDSGNPDDTPHYPSGYDNVVSVTAVSSSDVFSWANYGAASGNFYGVDLSAPGESMLSTYLTKSNSYAYLDGTSMASPFVASCFALLKSVYPDSSNEWLIDRILSNTDPIDEINPEYAGQLGTGRINMLKALVSDKWPNLSVSDQFLSISDGDGDTILNPGETVNLMIEVENDTGWADAQDIEGILTCNDDQVLIIDSVATWTSIASNRSEINSGNGFIVQFMNTANIKTYTFELKLVSNEAGDVAYRKTLTVNIPVYLDQEGFPYQAQTEVETSPLCIDVNEDGYKEIVFADKSGELYLIDALGADMPGFPISLNSQPGGIAVADIDLDDTLEIVVTLFNKKVEVYDVFGNYEWTRHSNLFITAVPAIGNVDDDEELEIVFGSYDQNIYALNHDSTNVLNFPYASGQLIHAGVSLVDLDIDGKDEIIYVSKGGQLGLIDADSIYAGWPVNTSASTVSEPQVIMNSKNEALILLGNDFGDMIGINLDGTQEFIVDGTGSIKTSPAVYAKDDNVYAFFASTTGNIYKIDLNTGTIASGWPRIFPTQFYGSLLIAESVNSESELAIVFALGKDGKIYAVDTDGNNVENSGFPLNTRFLSNSSLAMADIDEDGDNEIIAGNFSGISVIDVKSPKTKVHWPVHRGTIQRVGSVSSTWTGIQDITIPQEFDFELIGNAPNPFNPQTSIRYNLNAIMPVHLKVYRLDGKRIFSKTQNNSVMGLNEIIVDMDNYASGIYFYTLEAGTQIRKAKMIYLK
jgi:hypothetical protein